MVGVRPAAGPQSIGRHNQSRICMLRSLLACCSHEHSVGLLRTRDDKTTEGRGGPKRSDGGSGVGGRRTIVLHARQHPSPRQPP
jgi:hypothetical protein